LSNLPKSFTYFPLNKFCFQKKVFVVFIPCCDFLGSLIVYSKKLKNRARKMVLLNINKGEKSKREKKMKEMG
jgi:hypothetical protein